MTLQLAPFPFTAPSPPSCSDAEPYAVVDRGKVALALTAALEVAGEARAQSEQQ
jgi:hypothetical protein